MCPTAPTCTFHGATLTAFPGPSLHRSPPEVAKRNASFPKRIGAPLGRGQGWQFRSFRDFALKMQTRPATARTAPPFLGFRRPCTLHVSPAIATQVWGPTSVLLRNPRQFLVPRVPYYTELRILRLLTQPLHNSFSLGSRRRSFSAPRVCRFHPRLRKPPPRATPARHGPCPSRAPPPAVLPPPHVTRPRRGFR